MEKELLQSIWRIDTADIKMLRTKHGIGSRVNTISIS